MIIAERSRDHSIGWLISLCLHATLAVGAMLGTQRMTLAPQPIPFTWNVAMISAPSEPSQHPSAPSGTIHPPLNRPSSPMPLASTLIPPAKDTGSIATTVESILPADEKPTRVRKQAPPVQDTPPPMKVAEVHQALEEVIPPSQTLPPQRSNQPAESLSEVSSPTTSFTRGTEAGTPAQSPSAAVLSAQRPDYAWLSETIIRRMHELKRYPADARLDHAEGKVVLKAIIKSDGNVEAVEVFRSSGHQSLDRAAVELLNLAAPFHLLHSLGKPQMTVKIPMNYQLGP